MRARLSKQRTVHFQVTAGREQRPIFQLVAVGVGKLGDLREAAEAGSELGGDPRADDIDNADVLIQGSPSL